MRNLLQSALSSSIREKAILLAMPLALALVIGALMMSPGKADAIVSGGSISLNAGNSCIIDVRLNGATPASASRSGTITFSSVFSNQLVTCADSGSAYFSALCDSTPSNYTFQFTHTGPATSVTVSFVNGPLNNNIWSVGCAANATCMSQTLSLPDCGGAPATPPPSGGGTTTTPYVAPLPPLDPPGTAPRVYGGYDNPSSEVVVYQQSSTNYQFYSYSGVPIGQVNLGVAGIPGAGGLITTMSNAEFRVELFYDGGDYVRVKMYIGGQLVEDGRFQVPGIGARAGTAPGGGSASVGSVAGGGTVTVICSQKLRLDPSTGAATLDVLQPGAVLNVVARSNDASWLNVTTPDGLTGWTYNGRCINVNTSGLNSAPITVNLGNTTVGGQVSAPPANAPGPIQVNVPPGTPVIGIACGQNMRSGPATSYPVVRVLPAGSTLQVVGRSTDMFWVQVSAGTVNGWTTLGGGCSQMVDGDITAVPVMVETGG